MTVPGVFRSWLALATIFAICALGWIGVGVIVWLVYP